MDTTTGLTDANLATNNFRAIVSANGTGPFWAFGKGNIRYFPSVGATTSVAVYYNTVTNFFYGFMFVHPTDGPAIWALTAAGAYFMGLASVVTTATALPTMLALSGGGSACTEFVFSDTQTLWMADGSTGLYLFTAASPASTNAAMAASTWTKSAGYPVQPGGTGTAGVKASGGMQGGGAWG